MPSTHNRNHSFPGNKRLEKWLKATLISLIIVPAYSFAASPQLDSFDWPPEKKPFIPLKPTVYNVEASLDYLESFPDSSWALAQRTLHKSFLNSQKFDVVVAPFQTREYPFDHIARSLMTRYLIDAIETQYRVKVAHPDIVELATMRNDRAIDVQSVYDIANRAKAKNVVFGYVGHDLKGRMTVTIEVQRPQGGKFDKRGDKIAKRLVDIAFDDKRLPSEVFLHSRSRIINQIKLNVPRKPKVVKRDGAPQKVIEPIGKWTKGKDTSALRAAYRLQVMGALVPAIDVRLREQLFERSLVALANVRHKTPHYRLLKSRAYGSLLRRPAALKASSPANTASLRAMQARLNGNLPKLSQEVKKIKSPVARLLAEIEEADIRHWYHKSLGREKLDKIAKKYPDIEFLLKRRLHDSDDWYVQGNFRVKKEMDRLFPLPAFSIESIFKAKLLQGKRIIEKDIDLSVYRHYSKFLLAKQKWSFSNSWQPGAFDHLRMYYQLGEENLIDRSSLRKHQGLEESGLKELRALDSVYAQHPRFLLQKARLVYEQIDDANNQEIPQLVRKSSDDSIKAYVWGGNTYWGVFAFGRLQYFDRAPAYISRAKTLGWKELAALNLYYEVQYPIRSYWKMAKGPQGLMREPKYHRKMLEYSDIEFAPFKNLHYFLSYRVKNKLAIRGYGDKREGHLLAKSVIKDMSSEIADLENQLKVRFVGSQARYRFIEKQSMNKKDEKGLIRHYQTAIDLQSTDWKPYSKLSGLEMVKSNYKKAEEILWSYPLFHQKRNDLAVGLSNHAYSAGSRFFWRGKVKPARKFFQLAMSYKTGSHAGMSSAERDALLAGNYFQAAERSLTRVRRYGSDYSQRDYMNWLHAMGYSKDAWVIFDSILPKQRSTQIWTSAFVGHRINAASDKTIVAWVNSKTDRQNLDNIDRKGVRYLFQALALDRPVNPKLVGYINDVANNASSQAHKPKKKYLSNNQFVKFVKFYHLLKQKKYQEADKEAHGLTMAFNGERETPSDFILPYKALAAAKAGNSLAIRSLKSRFSETSRDGRNDWTWLSSLFYRDLAFAYIAATEKDHIKATHLLTRAFDRRNYTNYSPIFTYYQIVEACEWLYEDTGRDEYRQLALKWVKAHQQIRPMFAWAYAVEAKLTTNPDDRLRALGFAQHLDLHSERIRHFDKKTKRQARKWFKKNNPFVKQRDVTSGNA